MELLQLKYFKTVAETGKISAAAETLFLSPPALSTSISRLEKELGVTLFERNANRIRLNPQGVLFLRRVNRIFDELEQAKQELQQSIQPNGHHVSVATIASTQWVDLISAFSQTNSEITLSCSSVKISQLADSGLPTQHTFLLGSEDSVPEAYRKELEYMPLFQDAPMIVVHAEHPLAKRPCITINDLAEETLFLPMADYSLHRHLIAMFENSHLPFPTGNAYPHFACQKMASEQMGVSFASAHTVMLPSLNLRCVPIQTVLEPWTAGIFWRKRRKLSTEALAFLTFTEAYYSADRAQLTQPQHKV